SETLTVLVPASLTQSEVAEIRAAAPQAEPLPCGEPDEWMARAPRAEVLFLGPCTRELFLAAPRLRWIQVGSAGVERYLWPELLESSVLLTSAKGVFDVPIAEHLLAMVLAHARRLPLYRDQQSRRKWHREESRDVQGAVLCILGLGCIGRELARRASALGMEVHGLRRRRREAPEGVTRVWPAEGLHEMLALADYVAVTLPLTPATRGRVGRAELQAMKPGAFLMNIGRGAVIDEEALVDAIRTGRLSGAGLDVFQQEPLPPSSPLWDLPQVILTPHVSGSSPGNHRRTLDLFLDNLRRFTQGEELRNLVDKEAGY
ncbi:MAG TPA: D-2-hydroxyacid dehydrogenase, partial [Armatimonadota bacterium]